MDALLQSVRGSACSFLPGAYQCFAFCQAVHVNVNLLVEDQWSGQRVDGVQQVCVGFSLSRMNRTLQVAELGCHVISFPSCKFKFPSILQHLLSSQNKFTHREPSESQYITLTCVQIHSTTQFPHRRVTVNLRSVARILKVAFRQLLVVASHHLVRRTSHRKQPITDCFKTDSFSIPSNLRHQSQAILSIAPVFHFAQPKWSEHSN
jgi:hypothetical protein